MGDKAVVVLERSRQAEPISVDIEVPLDITANELVTALNQIYQLGIDTRNIKQCYLRCERPIVLLRGDRTLREFGVREGTRIHLS